MSELTSPESIEAEIADLSRAIEEKKALLEKSGKTVEHKELVREIVQETSLYTRGISPVPPPPAGAAPHYLDQLGNTEKDKIDRLTDEVFKRGIKRTLASLKGESPFVIDAFHDLLVDKLYEDLKKKGIVK